MYYVFISLDIQLVNVLIHVTHIEKQRNTNAAKDFPPLLSIMRSIFDFGSNVTLSTQRIDLADKSHISRYRTKVLWLWGTLLCCDDVFIYWISFLIKVSCSSYFINKDNSNFARGVMKCSKGYNINDIFQQRCTINEPTHCKNCETCILTQRINQTSAWFIPLSYTRKKEFLLRLISSCRNIKSILDSVFKNLCSKDFQYCKSRIISENCYMDSTDHSLDVAQVSPRNGYRLTQSRI